MVKNHNIKNPSKKTYQFGYFAEKYVMIFLWIKGYKILKHRYKSSFGEIDVIAKKKNFIVFIEVKARYKKINIENVLTAHQIQRIKKSAEDFIAKNRKLQNCSRRFDFIEVRPIFFLIFNIKHRINFIS
jgi:putative endonuclease